VSEPHRTFFKSDLPTRFDRKKAAKLEADSLERRVYRIVTLREGHRCRVCGKRCNPGGIGLLDRGHHHHIRYRSAGGETTTWNVCLLDKGCHDRVHLKCDLRIEGDADLALTFWAKDENDCWYVSAQEEAPGRIARD
jgi:hypothetical protein